MVESTTVTKSLVSNPTPVRGMRTPITMMGEYTVFGSEGNLIAAKGQSLENHVMYTHNDSHVSAISAAFELTPAGSGRYHVAIGTNAGKVLMLRFQNQTFEKVNEYNCFAEPVREILWGNNGKMLFCLGKGAVVFNPDTSG